MSPDVTDDRIAGELASGDGQVRLAAILEVIRTPAMRLSGDAREALLACFAAERKSIARKAMSAAAAAASHDPHIIPALRDALRAPDARVRWGAAYTLSLIDGALDLAALPAMIEALGSDDGDIRWAAAELIVRLGADYPSEVRHSLLAVAVEAGVNTRKMALYCMRDLRLDDPEIRHAARDATEAADSHVRLAALSLLGVIDARAENVALIIKCLEGDASEGVRRAAAGVLGRLGSRSDRVLDALRRAAADDTDASLRKAASQALAKLRRDGNGAL